MLTKKQERFIEAYKELGDATKACIVAGYAPKSANVEASRMLKRVEIIDALNEWRKERQKEFKREDFIDYALKDYQSLEVTEPNKPRFLHLAGQAAGHIGNDSRPHQTLNITMNKMELKSLPVGEKWDALRKMLEAD